MRSSSAFSFLLALALATAGCAERSQNEIHLIPEGYVGPVVIFFNQPDGQPLEDGKRVYRVGADGIARVAASPNPGLSSSEIRKYFYVAADDSRRELPQDDVPPSGLQIFGGGMGSTFLPTADGGEREFTYMGYFVGVPEKRSDWGALFNATKRRATGQEP